MNIEVVAEQPFSGLPMIIILSVQFSFEPQIFKINYIILTHKSGCLQSIKMKSMRGIYRKNGIFLEERRLAVINYFLYSFKDELKSL